MSLYDNKGLFKILSLKNSISQNLRFLCRFWKYHIVFKLTTINIKHFHPQMSQQYNNTIKMSLCKTLAVLADIGINVHLKDSQYPINKRKFLPENHAAAHKLYHNNITIHCSWVNFNQYQGNKNLPKKKSSILINNGNMIKQGQFMSTSFYLFSVYLHSPSHAVFWHAINKQALTLRKKGIPNAWKHGRQEKYRRPCASRI